MQIYKKFNKLKNFYNKHFLEYYFTFFFAGESHQAVKITVTHCIQVYTVCKWGGGYGVLGR